MAIACAVCGRGGPDEPNLYRISDNFGQPGVWACAKHERQAVDNLARAKGPAAVLPHLQFSISPELRSKR